MRRFMLKLRLMIKYNCLSDFREFAEHTKIKFARSPHVTLVLLLRDRFIRIYQRKRYRTDFSPSASVHGTLETFTVEILNHSRRTETDRYQDGGRGRGTDEPQPRRLCNGGPSRGLAGPHERGERPARLVPPSRLSLFLSLSLCTIPSSLLSSPYPAGPLFFLPLHSFSLADSSLSSLPWGRRMPTALAKATRLVEANKCATD